MAHEDTATYLWWAVLSTLLEGCEGSVTTAEAQLEADTEQVNT